MLERVAYISFSGVAYVGIVMEFCLDIFRVRSIVCLQFMQFLNACMYPFMYDPIRITSPKWPIGPVIYPTRRQTRYTFTNVKILVSVFKTE